MSDPALGVDVIRATYVLEPVAAADELAELVSIGVPWGPAAARAVVVAEEPIVDARGRVTLGFPLEFWGDDVTLLLSTVIAGEMADRADVTACRLVGLDLPAGLFSGPAFAAPDRFLVGATLAPAAGASPRDLGTVAADLVRGGVDVIVDPVALADPPWCPLEDRVAAVAGCTPDDVPYFANLTGNAGTLMHRAATAIDMGAGGLVVEPGIQGLDAVRLLREADLGVPLLAHRVGFAPWLRSERFGVAPDALAGLLRLIGADCVMCGAVGGSRAGRPEEVMAQVLACRVPIEGGSVPASVAVLDGIAEPAAVAAEVERLAGTGLMVLLDHQAYRYPGGVEAAIRGTVEALDLFEQA